MLICEVISREPMDQASRMVRAERLGYNLKLFHSTMAAENFDSFLPYSHFGTIQQSNQRSGGNGSGFVRTIPVMVRLGRVKRLTDRDNGNWSQAKLKGLARQGYDGAVYLNRYEGIPYEEFEAARSKGIDLDGVSDAVFRKNIPSAQDSYIVFDPKNVKSVHAMFDQWSVSDDPFMK